MDLSQAFDCVNREKLWKILLSIGLDVKLVDFIRELHVSTTARISIDGQGGISLEL